MNNDLCERLDTLKNTYYQTNSKNTFFNGKQKKECAKIVSGTIDMQTLLINTCFQLGNTNKIYFQYSIFKTFATDENVNQILDFLLQLLENIIDKFGSFELHINMNTYTVTAHERYKNMYKLLFSRCEQNNILFSDKLITMNIYNTPSIINNLQAFFAPFIDKNAADKIVLINKKNSDLLLENLFMNNNIKR
jgi:hypothetical protein